MSLDLVDLMADTKQELPDWLAALAKVVQTEQRASNSRKYGGSARRYGPGGFGGRDFRLFNAHNPQGGGARKLVTNGFPSPCCGPSQIVTPCCRPNQIINTFNQGTTGGNYGSGTDWWGN